MTHVPQWQQPAPESRPQRSTGKKVFLFGCLPAVALGLIVVGGCTALVGGAAHEVDKAVKQDKKDDVRAKKEDVKLTSCKVEVSVIGKDVEAEVKITNHGKKRATYLVEGEFNTADGDQVGSLMASAENLAPGASTTQPFAGLFTSDQLKGVTKGTCSVLKVQRDEWSAAN